MQRYFEAHRATLESALKAAGQRTYWSAASETPTGKIYGETGGGGRSSLQGSAWQGHSHSIIPEAGASATARRGG